MTNAGALMPDISTDANMEAALSFYEGCLYISDRGQKSGQLLQARLLIGRWRGRSTTRNGYKDGAALYMAGWEASSSSQISNYERFHALTRQPQRSAVARTRTQCSISSRSWDISTGLAM